MRRLLPSLALALALGAALWFLLGDDTPPPPPELPVPTDPADAETDAPPPLRTVEAPETVRPTTPLDEAERIAGAARAARLTGEVLDERGRGLDGARVTVVPVDPAALRGAPYADGAPLAETTTDRQGDFELLDVPGGRWLRVLAARDGYATVGRLVPSAGAHVVIHLPPAGGLVLTVVDTEDAPVAEAAVQAASGETRLEATTDAAGRARFDALPPGAVRLRLLMGVRGTSRAGPYRIRAGTTLERTVVVAAGVRLEGIVLDADTDAPIADARIRVATPGRAAEATTDAQGRFGPVAAGGAGERVLVAVEARDHAPRLEPVILGSEDTQTVALHLERAPPWQGRVLDAAGAPVPGARVHYTADGIALPMRGAETTTDEAGRFVLPPPPPPAPGRRVVLVARHGGALGALPLRPDQLPPEPLELRLAAGATVTGRVVDGEGAGRVGVAVRLTPAWRLLRASPPPPDLEGRLHAFNAVGNQGLATATDAAGRWRIDGVPAGPYLVRVRAGAHEIVGEQPVTVEGGRVDAGDTVLGGGITLVGTVVDARGEGVPGVEVTLGPEDDGAGRRSTHTAGDGSFEIPWLAEGVARLQAALPGHGAVRRDVTLEAGATNRVRLTLDDPARLRLRIEHDARPYRGLLTVVFGETGSGRAATRRVTLRVAGGEAVIEDPPRGTWTLEAFAPGGLRGQAKEVGLEAGRETAAGIALAPGARLAGTVRTASGEAVPGALLGLSHPETGARHAATADAAGRYAFDALPPGDYTLTVRGRGGAAIEQPLLLGTGEQRDLDPTLDPSGRLRITVLDARGQPARGARLMFRRTTGGAIRTARVPRTDAEGRLLQDSLPVGALLVIARDADGRRGGVSTFVEAGATTDVVLRLEAAR